MRTLVKIVCEQCGKEFEATYKKRKFCSSSCAAICHNTGRVVTIEHRRKVSLALTGKHYHGEPKVKNKICKKCGKEFYPNKSFRKYCSYACFLKDKNRGRHNNGKISYRTFMKILKRAFPSWKCPLCDWSMTFEVHHVNGRKDNAIESLVMVCPNHHSAIHKGYLDKDQLLLLENSSIGNSYSKEDLIKRFYQGNNTEINFEKYSNDNDKVRVAHKGRMSAIVDLLGAEASVA